MEIHREQDMVRIKQKMTEIKRNRKAPIMHNYYLNCEKDEEIYALYGQSTVVFWDDDRGVRRAYFYSSDTEELTQLLARVPEHIILDYLTRQKGELHELFERAGWSLLHEMHRMSSVGITPEEQQRMAKRRELFDIVMYQRDKVRPAVEADCDVIYQKLYEVFDSRESHLCTREELLQYIRNRWVSVYYEEGNLLGFHIFLVENNTFYGYQIWSAIGPEGYYSLSKTSDRLFAEYVKDIPVKKIKPSYGWVNIKNKRARRMAEFWGQRFDGLYDFVYERLPVTEIAQKSTETERSRED